MFVFNIYVLSFILSDNTRWFLGEDLIVNCLMNCQKIWRASPVSRIAIFIEQ